MIHLYPIVHPEINDIPGNIPVHISLIWGFPKSWGYPQIIQVIRQWLSIETHGDLGIPHFKKQQYGDQMIINHII